MCIQALSWVKATVLFLQCSDLLMWYSSDGLYLNNIHVSDYQSIVFPGTGIPIWLHRRHSGYDFIRSIGQAAGSHKRVL